MMNTDPQKPNLSQFAISPVLENLQAKILEICQHSSLDEKVISIFAKQYSSFTDMDSNTQVALHPLSLMVDYPIPESTEDYDAFMPFRELALTLKIIENTALTYTHSGPKALTIAEQLSNLLHRRSLNLDTGQAHILLKQEKPWKIKQDQKDPQCLIVELYYQITFFYHCEKGIVL